MSAWLWRKLLRHEAQFDEGADAVGQQAVVDLVDVREVVDRLALFVLVVDADFVVKDGVEAHVWKSVTCFTSRRSRR